MREYKFRGKVAEGKNKGDWIIGNLIVNYYTNEHYIDQVGHGLKFKVIPETVGQYTEQQDDSEQENEIYDNDILLGTWSEPTDEYHSEEIRSDMAKVYWDEVWGQWIVKEKTTGEKYPLYDYCDEVVVIGNMIDNPELMEMK